MRGTMSPDQIKAEVAKRLKRLRYAWGCGDSPTQWCEFLGDSVSKGQWAFYERGERWLPPDVAVLLCVKTGVTTDWLYRGLEWGVPSAIMGRINALSDAESLPPA